jgi:uncharacterized protein
VRVYFDTSAFVPMFVEEAGSEASLELWRSATTIASTRLLFVEAMSALARRRSTDDEVAKVDHYWEEVQILELDEQLMEMAGAAALEFGLRGFDAVHCAAGASLGTESVVLASADQRLLRAWRSLGCATFDPTRN